jgi:hypothetical protein
MGRSVPNVFEQFADSQLTAAAKRRHKDIERRAAKSVVTKESEAPMKGTAREEARDERDALVARYRRAIAQERDELLHGPYGSQISTLQKYLRVMEMEGSGKLVKMVCDAPWLRGADQETKRGVLSMIADAILRVRVRNGLSPFDDSIDPEPPTAFQVIRKSMMGV